MGLKEHSLKTSALRRFSRLLAVRPIVLPWFYWGLSCCVFFNVLGVLLVFESTVLSEMKPELSRV